VPIADAPCKQLLVQDETEPTGPDSLHSGMASYI
jgi:hypothetical protein